MYKLNKQQNNKRMFFSLIEIQDKIKLASGK